MSPPGLWSQHSGRPAGPLVGLIHGSLDRSAGLLRLARRLDGQACVLRYDRRGYGRSTPHAGPFDMDAQVADLVTLLAGRPAVLVGHSFGGDVALATAVRHPELVRGVVVYEPPLSWLPWWPTTTAGSQALDKNGDGDGDDHAEAAERFMRRLIGDHRWERLPARTRQARRDEGAAMIGELADLRDRAPWEPAAVGVPVVALAGELGADHHRRGVAHLGEVLADVRTVEIAGAKHFGPNTHPDAVAAEVLGVLDRLPA
ncbi:MAG: alpha/beta fold hydrolase [Desertimonas sp.]